MPTAKEKKQGYLDKHLIPTLWATIWILTSLTIFMAGLLGVFIGRVTQ